VHRQAAVLTALRQFTFLGHVDHVEHFVLQVYRRPPQVDQFLSPQSLAICHDQQRRRLLVSTSVSTSLGTFVLLAMGYMVSQNSDTMRYTLWRICTNEGTFPA